MHRQDRILVKAKDGTGDKKSQDILAEVGAFRYSFLLPVKIQQSLLLEVV
jgi:hypothetical protein